MSFNVVQVESPDGKHVLRDLRERGFVLLAGSAVSEWEESNLPTGKALTCAVADILSEHFASKPIVKQWIEASAFEHVMEGCPDRETLGDNLLELFSPVKPNPIHEVIGRLFAAGIIEHIVTTNYDLNLETACGRQEGLSRPPQLIVTEAESEIRSLQAAIFKVHGSVGHDQRRRPSEIRTMVYTLGKEGELPVWKRRLLYRLVGGRRLLVCGYSGRDFEICPELTRLNAEVVWNAWKEENLTANARRVLSSGGGTALIGDMRSVFSELDAADLECDVVPIEANLLSSRTDIKENISQNLTEWDLNLWRVRTLVGIGAATEGIGLATSMLNASGSDTARQFEALLNLGRSQFHGGKYRQAIVVYRQAVELGEREGQREWILKARSDLFEALRCHGKWSRARRELLHMQSMINPDEAWAVAFRSVLLLRYYYQLARAIRILPWKVRQIRARCKELLRMVVHHARHEQWLELQQAELCADRLDIRFSEIYDGPLNPLPSKDGYKQLGYLIAESMAIRDELIRKGGETEEDIPRMMSALKQAGALAEFWKLARVASRFKGGVLVDSSQRRDALRAWWACEYTPLMRLFITFFH